MSASNPQSIEAGCEALESEKCEIYRDSVHRIVYGPIPFNGINFVINALLRFNDIGLQISGSEADTLVRLREGALLSNAETPMPGNDSWMRFAIIREPVERLYAAFIDQAVRGDQSSDLTFAQFAHQVIGSDSINASDRFRSQASYLAGCTDSFEWLIPFEQLSKLMTVLEHRTGQKISRKRMVRTARYGSVTDLSGVRELNGRELRNLDRLPNAGEMAGIDLEKTIRKAFHADSELYQNALTSFPPRVASEHEQQIFTRLRQVSSKTSDHRYPEIFRFVASRIDHSEQPLKTSAGSANIASFGCSTGEECFSLRSHFPSATIHGFDLRRRSLDLANERNNDPKIAFHFSDERNLSAHGPFDAIFAMSVFCRWPDVIDLAQCQDVYAFAEFQSDVELLDKYLKPGGLLVIYNAMFRFTDLNLAKGYQPHVVAAQPESGFVTKFSRGNQRLIDQTYPFTAFEKL